MTQAMHFENQKEWIEWLEHHHRQEEGVTLLFYKKHLHRGMSYEEALEAALCYGWIDATLHRIDDTSHTIRFSPRRTHSIWSHRNKLKALALIEEKKMQTMGFEKIEEAKANGRWEEADETGESVPEILLAALNENPQAKAFYDTLPKSVKEPFHRYIQMVKRDKTKAAHLKEVMEKLEANKRFYDA